MRRRRKKLDKVLELTSPFFLQKEINYIMKRALACRQTNPTATLFQISSSWMRRNVACGQRPQAGNLTAYLFFFFYRFTPHTSQWIVSQAGFTSSMSTTGYGGQGLATAQPYIACANTQASQNKPQNLGKIRKTWVVGKESIEWNRQLKLLLHSSQFRQRVQ